MTASLYRWPHAAAFGRVVPKSKFYEHASLPAAVRERFIAEVQRVVWAYKLADETVHLRGSAEVLEIQVFAVDAKRDDVSNAVLAAVDKAVQTPIIFEINCGADDQSRTRMAAGYKPSRAGTTRPSTYFTTDWLASDAPRTPLPPAVDLPGLYTQLLAPLLPIALRQGEGLEDATGRVEGARRLEREIATIEQRLRNEPQLNRKFDLRHELQDRTAALTALTNATTSTTEDVPWTS